jgi:hypothetical protein
MTIDPSEETARPCAHCHGEGQTVSAAGDGSMEPCSWCTSRGVDGIYERPDFEAIWNALGARRGKNTGRVRSSPPAYTLGNLFACRVYFVWMCYRFGAGLSTSNPLTLSFLKRDPWTPELEALAQQLIEATQQTPA